VTRSADTPEKVIPPLPIEVEPLSTHDWSYNGNGNHQWIYRFPNGYGASVVKGPRTYGGPEGFYEMAVLRYDGDESHLTYDTPITDDVLGWQTIEDIAAALVKVAAL
jgi:hypothetical protein